MKEGLQGKCGPETALWPVIAKEERQVLTASWKGGTVMQSAAIMTSPPRLLPDSPLLYFHFKAVPF